MYVKTSHSLFTLSTLVTDTCFRHLNAVSSNRAPKKAPALGLEKLD